MASQYWGANRGADLSPDRISTDTSTTSKDVELRVDLTKNLTRAEVYEITEALVRAALDGRTTTLKL